MTNSEKPKPVYKIPDGAIELAIEWNDSESSVSSTVIAS